MLNVPIVNFPSVLSSPTASSSRPSASTSTRARSLCQSPSAPACWSGPGRMADPTPNTHVTRFGDRQQKIHVLVAKFSVFSFTRLTDQTCVHFSLTILFDWQSVVLVRHRVLLYRVVALLRRFRSQSGQFLKRGPASRWYVGHKNYDLNWEIVEMWPSMTKNSKQGGRLDTLLHVEPRHEHGTRAV